ncbi:hypothetical protein BHE74_00047764 [Ensete ventricosum]|nr:hypothetical protein BHE74_00047764 [Ensete ventricosum]
MSTESFELAIPLTSVSFAQLFRSLRNTSHFARSHLSPSAPLALSTVKFGCQCRAVARTQPSESLCATHSSSLACPRGASRAKAVVSPPPCLVDSHNGVRTASTRDTPRWQSEVDGYGCSGCNFDAGLSTLARLFLQDNNSRVMGSRGGPSDDQVRVDRKGEVRRPA